MILTHSLKVCLAVAPCDLRKSSDGLAAVVRWVLGEDPLPRKAFVFANRSRDRGKLLCRDGTGLREPARRLERGRFRWLGAAQSGKRKMALEPAALDMLPDGIDLRGGDAPRVVRAERKMLGRARVSP